MSSYSKHVDTDTDGMSAVLLCFKYFEGSLPEYTLLSLLV
jgi:hypothetical protein